MVAKSFKQADMKAAEPVVARGVVTYARKRYRAGEEIVAATHKERKQLLDTALAVEPSSELGKKLKARHAEWLKTQALSAEGAAKKTAAEELSKKTAAEDAAKKVAAEEAHKRGFEDRRGGRGQPNRQQGNQQAPQQQSQVSPSVAAQLTPPLFRPAVGGLPPAMTDDNGKTTNTETKE